MRLTVLERLQAPGIRAEQVTDIVLIHMDYDHAGSFARSISICSLARRHQSARTASWPVSATNMTHSERKKLYEREFYAPSWVELVRAEAKNASLTKRTREVVILSVGAVWKAPFELYAHSAVDRKVGVPEPAIQALVAGKNSEQLSLEEQVAHRFSRQLAKEFRVDPDLYREADSISGRAGLVDMVF